MSDRTGVTVVGSAHMDLIATAAEMPTLGGSVIGSRFAQSPGGKAGNQAAQLARLGVKTWLVAKIGTDPLGDQIVSDLGAAGIDLAYLGRSPDVPTGASTVFAVGGEYASIIVPGAAATLSRADLERSSTAFEQSRFVVTQLELGPDLAQATFETARQSGAVTVLNASPLPRFEPRSLDQVLRLTDILVVNRHEASRLAATAVPDREAAGDAAKKISARFDVDVVVITCGSSGAVLARSGSCLTCDAFPISVVDSVGAGDAFLGGLLAAWMDGGDERAALRLASAAGAIAVSGAGAFTSLPNRVMIDEFLSGRA